MFKNTSEKSFIKSLGPKLDSFKTTLRLLIRNPGSAIGLIIVLIYIVIAIIDEVDPSLLGLTGNINILSTNPTAPIPIPPSLAYPFGTSVYGINLYQGVMKAIRIDVAFSFLVVGAGSLIGIILGLYAAYYGGIVDEILMRITDIFFSIPLLVLIIAAGFFIPNGRSIGVLAIILIILWWPTYARVVRGQVLSLKELSYVEAARSCGVGQTKIMFKHILPNTLAPVIVQLSFDLASVVLLLSTLDFLGFIPSGGLLADLGLLTALGYPEFDIGYWWALLVPSFAILLFALSMNLLGDGMRDAFDPRLRR
ncbi:MAG: ABC transporter permease [Thermoplasmata archaeon]